MEYDKFHSQRPVKLIFLPAVFLAYIYSWRVLEKTWSTEEPISDSRAISMTMVQASRLRRVLKICRLPLASMNNVNPFLLICHPVALLIPERWLSVYIYSNSGEIKFIKNHDHCVDNNIFLNSLPLVPSLTALNKTVDKVLLLSSDTVTCNDEKVPGLDNWGSDVKLEKLKSIQFRETYIGVIELSTFSVTELKSKESIQLP